MKIMTFNTQHCQNFLTGKIDFQIMADAINSCNAQIVGLNEMRDKGRSRDYGAQAQKLSELTGIKHFYFAKAIDVNGKNPYGNALLSAFPVICAETISVPDPEEKTGSEMYESRCLLKAELENGFTVLVIHFGLNKDEQENAVKTVLENIADEKCILMGDFNAEPDDRVLLPIKQHMVDTADMISGNSLTFPSDKPQKKIDYIFVSRDLTVNNAQIPEIIASDHRPHTAEVYLPGEQ